MSLLPSSGSDSESTQDGSFRVLDLDDEHADAVFDALSSATTRTMLAELHRTPSTPAELADGTDTTVQNAMYHLDKLENAGLVRVVDRRYSSRGKEMRVYAPAEQPAVVFLGTDDRRSGLVAKLKQLLGALGFLGLLGFGADLLNGIEQSVGSQLENPHTTLVAAVGVFAALATSRSADDADGLDTIPRTIRKLNPMNRKTLLMTVVLLGGVCATPVAIAHSPAVSGEYTTSTAPASTTSSDANAGVPDLSNETVTVVVTGGTADVRTGVSQQLTATLRDRGATVTHADRIHNVSGSLFAVRLADSRVDAGLLTVTPSANLTAYFTYVESGNATLASSVLEHERTADRGPRMFLNELDGRAAVGSFSFERGTYGLIDALNTIKRGGTNPTAFERDVGATVANTTVDNAFAERLWT